MENFKEHKFRICGIEVKSELIKNKDDLGNVISQYVEAKGSIDLSSIGDFSDFVDKDGKLIKEDLEYHILTRLFSKDITDQIIADIDIITL